MERKTPAKTQEPTRESGKTQRFSDITDGNVKNKNWQQLPQILKSFQVEKLEKLVKLEKRRVH